MHTIGDFALPADVQRVLELGTKCAMEPARKAPELVGVVRKVARLAPEDECASCVSHGVDILERWTASQTVVPIKRILNFLAEKKLCVLPADKDGGFAVLPHDVFREKASDAILSCFDCRDNVSLKKVKAQARNRCRELGLTRLVNSIENNKKLSLDMFFSVKTHKVERPFRVIVSEKGTWQKSLAVFLQKNLNLL